MRKPILTEAQQRFAVESGIPVAPKRQSKIYPFMEMRVGDSFALKDNFREVCNARARVRAWNIVHAPMEFVVRLDKASGRYRCWRIA